MNRILNNETLEAVREVEDMKLNPLLGKVYKDVDDMMKELLDDPFYTETNMVELRRRLADIENGTANLVEHDLIEDNIVMHVEDSTQDNTVDTGKEL